MSQFVNLLVITPRAEILEPRTLTVKNGENFSLTCVLKQVTIPKESILFMNTYLLYLIE